MVLCLDSTGVINTVLMNLSLNVTGNMFISLFIIVLLLLVIAMAMRIPIEFTIILVMPLLIASLACDNDWLGVAGIAVIYLGILLGKNLFFR